MRIGGYNHENKSFNLHLPLLLAQRRNG